MHPILMSIAIGSRLVEIHAFGLMIAMGFLFGTLLAVREAERRGGAIGVAPQMVKDLALWGLGASLLGARLADLMAEGRAAWDDCLGGATVGLWGTLAACTRPLRPWEGGLVFYGGVIAGLATIAIFARRHAVSFGALADLASRLEQT